MSQNDNFQKLQAELIAGLEARSADLVGISGQIHARPELRFAEHFASGLLAETLSKAGLEVVKPFGGLETAFCAQIGNGDGPTVAILAEYDALPEIGHACGHNLIAAAALGAGLSLAAVRDKLPGKVLLMGTPAEEGGGGKIRLIEAGAFKSVDAAMMFHPFDRSVLALDALARHTLFIDFTGKPSHAAAAPWDGNSALSGVIQSFNLIDALRLHLRDGVRIHGIITNGGQADNIIPETAAALFSLRAPDAGYLDEVVVPRVEACVQAAALATGTQVVMRLERGYKNMLNNMTLAQAFGRHLGAAEVPHLETDPTSGIGSTDMGDVSQVVPSIHPYLAICNKGETICHQHLFQQYAGSKQGYDVMLTAARCLALTALDLLGDRGLLEAVKAEFRAGR